MLLQPEADGGGLAYAYALRDGYLTLMDEPDRKEAWNPEKAADYLERSVRRAYAPAEAQYLINKAREPGARKGVRARSAGLSDRLDVTV